MTCELFSKPLFPSIFTRRLIPNNHWSGFRPLVFATPSPLGSHRNSSWTSHCCPVLWRSGSPGSTGSILPPPRNAPADHKWAGCWGGSIHNPGFGPGCLQGWSHCQLCPVITTRMSSPALCWLLHSLK